jgi:hypothetical protein
MLTREQFVELYRKYRDEQVLSVYLDAGAHDPAVRNAWRRVLDHCVDEARATLDGQSNEHHAAFDSALRLLRDRLDGYDSFLPGAGWVGFATPTKVLYAKPVPVPMPNLVRWEPGPRAAPYVRALKQQRPVVTVLADSRRARVFRYHDGELEESADLRADTFLGDLSDVGQGKRATTRTGIRGVTSTDAAQRYLEVGTDRMLKQLIDVVVEQAGPTGFIVIGGTPEAGAAVRRGLPKTHAGRALELPSLYVDMTTAEVKDATGEAASALTREHQTQLLDHVLNTARAGGRGCIGLEETQKALTERRVETLLLSRSFIQSDVDRADFCVGAAFEQNAEVEELSGEAADRLDAEGGGIAAELRYRV